MNNIVIVGGGIGGLCSAVRLLIKGFKVTILEKEPTVGGKVNRKEIKDFNFDLTASILMTPKVYTDIFKDLGKNYKDYFEMIRLEPIYNVFYADKTQYSFYRDLKKTNDVLESIESGLSQEYEEFFYKTMKKYLIANNNFLCKPMLNMKEILNVNSIKSALQMDVLENSNKYLSSMIHNRKLNEYLIFQAMYMGVNPYKNTNLYTMIPAISHAYGLSYIKGGLYQYICALQRLIYEQGGQIETNTEVKKIVIRNNNVVGVRTKDLFYEADCVICNADYPYAVKKLITDYSLGESCINNHIDKKEYSCSVFMIYLGLNKKYDVLNVHNIYISKDFKKSIEDPFNGNLSKNPSIYMYYPSAVDESLCSKSKSVLNIMVRVPNLSFETVKWTRKDIMNYRNVIIKHISDIKGLEDIEKHIECEDYLIPDDLDKKFNAFKGNAFGLSHKLSQDIYLRPHIKSEKIKGLYFIGSSTHPGNGVSIIINGTKVLADIICEDFR